MTSLLPLSPHPAARPLLPTAHPHTHAGRYVLELMKRDLKPRDIMTAAAFENAMVLVMATGGSTNAGGCVCGVVWLVQRLLAGHATTLGEG